MNKFSKKPYGFTLVELMVTIAIAAILMMVAVPSYTDFIKRNTVESLQSRLSAAVVTARTEAASRNVTTTLCPSSTGTSCTGDATTWSSGWIVFTDANADQLVTANVDTVLLVYKQASADYPVKFQNESATALIGISFTNQGFTKDSVRAFATICEPKKDVKYARGLTIERSGRVMKSSDTVSTADTDTIHDIVFDTGTAVAPTPVNITCP